MDPTLQAGQDLYGDIGVNAPSSGPVVPHSGMGGGALGILLILLAWMWVQHRYYREETAIPHMGIVFLALVYLSVWILERGTRAAQSKWPNTITDFLAI